MPDSRLAVWKSKRWAILVAVFVPISYFLSAPMMWYFTNLYAIQQNLILSPMEITVLDGILDYYRPVRWCSQNFGFCAAVWDWEWKLMVSGFGRLNFGPPQLIVPANPPPIPGG